MENEFIHSKASTVHTLLWGKATGKSKSKNALEIAEGRDNESRDSYLKTALMAQLGIIDFLPVSLKKINAQTYLTAFLGQIAPLAEMYKEICDYCMRTNLKRSQHAQSVKWDFTVGSDQIEIDVAHFRRYKWNAQSFPNPDRFDDFARTFQSAVRRVAPNVRSPTQNFNMHEPIDTWASRPLKLIHAELSKIWSLPVEERYRHFKYANEFPSLFYQLSCTSKSLTSKEFDNLRVPTYDLSTLDPQDILDLPFWKFRWQIYELWTIVKSLWYLEGFGFELLFSHDGKSFLEQGRKAMLAKRHVPPLGYAYAQSNFQNVEGKDVHPDLVISTCGNIDALQPEDIALVIEAKQRKNSGSFEPHRKKHFEDVLNKYSKSTRHRGATVILNYDALPEQLEMPKETLALSEFYPGKADECQLFGFMQKHLPEWASNYRDSGKKIIVLDYSTSMQWVGFHKAREELKKFQQLWPQDTFTYGTAEDRFFPLTNNEIFDEEYPSTLWGAERAETLAKGILSLPDRDNISHVVFLTDLSQDETLKFSVDLSQYSDLPSIRIFSVLKLDY